MNSHPYILDLPPRESYAATVESDPEDIHAVQALSDVQAQLAAAQERQQAQQHSGTRESRWTAVASRRRRACRFYARMHISVPGRP